MVVKDDEIVKRFENGQLIKNIAKDLGLNHIKVGKHLRLMGYNTRSGKSKKLPTLAEIQERAAAIKQHNLEILRNV